MKKNRLSLRQKKYKRMKTRQEYIDLLKAHALELQTRFGITYMRLFGSVAKNMHHEGSDVDVYVEMPSQVYNVVAASDFLKDILGCNVDLICKHQGMRPFFLNQIEKYGIDIFRAT